MTHVDNQHWSGKNNKLQMTKRCLNKVKNNDAFDYFGNETTDSRSFVLFSKKNSSTDESVTHLQYVKKRLLLFRK